MLLLAEVYTNGAIFVQGGYRYSTDDELALLVGHEIAHNILSHWDEKNAINVLNDITNMIELPFECARQANFYFRIVNDDAYYKIHRLLELESDYVGAFLAARSCYDVRMAPVKWKKRNLFYHQNNRSANNLEIENTLSTHPDDLTRASIMEEIVPMLLQERLSVGCPKLNDTTDPRDVFEEFKEFIYKTTEKFEIDQFEKFYYDMISEKSAIEIKL